MKKATNAERDKVKIEASTRSDPEVGFAVAMEVKLAVIVEVAITVEFIAVDTSKSAADEVVGTAEVVGIVEVVEIAGVEEGTTVIVEMVGVAVELATLGLNGIAKGG